MDSRPGTTDAGRNTKYAQRDNGSAIILAIVLTTLLAIIAVMFLLSSRMDMLGTSAIADNKNLNLAVDTVIARISEKLALDVPGGAEGWEYYDYPDANNAWLACLEPYLFASPSDYRWRQVSNIYGAAIRNISADIVPDYQPRISGLYLADADGDGVSDSNWIQIPGITSNKGKPIFAAVRIIDNGAMLNVNTGLFFDPCSSIGASQTDVNLFTLAQRGSGNTLEQLNNARRGNELWDLSRYIDNVVWQYVRPDGNYTPFDISDALTLRYRYILNSSQSTTRIENLWNDAFKTGLDVPRNEKYHSISNPDHWFWYVNNDSLDPNNFNKYDYRHIATTYNYDRIIDPNGGRMLNVNRAPVIDPNFTRDTIAAALVAGGAIPADANSLAAQITANLIDYVDADSNVTVIDANIGGISTPRFGFETPCIYISEIAQRFIHYSSPNDVNIRSYAIELHKPYWEDDFPFDSNNGWQLWVDGNTMPINWSGSRRFHVIEDIKVLASIDVNFNDVQGPNDLNLPADPCNTQPSPYVAFSGGSIIELRRRIPDGSYVVADRVLVPEPNNSTGWLIDIDVNDANSRVYSYQRDIWPHKPIKRFWSLGVLPSIGRHLSTDFMAIGSPVQAHPANRPFTNIGEFGQLFYAPVYEYGGIGPNFYIPVNHESELRINLALPVYQQVFNYLTVFDPVNYGHDVNENRIKGRINVNTAPWFVIAQLPWVTDPALSSDDKYKLAQAITAYRDKTNLVLGVIDYYQLGANNSRQLGMGYAYTVNENPGFASIGELMNVTNNLDKPASYDSRYDIRKYAADVDILGLSIDQPSLPDISPSDGAANDFEERDVIFDRINNLVTVRSDVFTAYILVRIPAAEERNTFTGEVTYIGGYQKRVVAILDRSKVPQYPVKVIAVQSVPDPR